MTFSANKCTTSTTIANNIAVRIGIGIIAQDI